MKNIVITICEGPHDAAFLYKILRHLGFKSYSKKIKEMPELMKGYFKGRMEEYNYEDVNLENIKPPLPTILSRNDVYFLLYPVGGDEKIKEALRIVADFKKSKEKQWLFRESYDYAFVFFYDANKRGVGERVEGIRRHFSDLLGNIEALGHNKIITTRVGRIGCFIFSKDGNTGRLEDVILPLMKIGKENEDIFEDAGLYIEKHFDRSRLKRKDHFDYEKALIGIAGQLQRSGCTNTVIIQHADYLSEEKIKNDNQCKEICAFFDEFR